MKQDVAKQLEQDIIDTLGAISMNIAEVTQKTDRPRSTVRSALERMTERGVLVKNGGLYRVAEHAPVAERSDEAPEQLLSSAEMRLRIIRLVYKELENSLSAQERLACQTLIKALVEKP